MQVCYFEHMYICICIYAYRSHGKTGPQDPSAAEDLDLDLGHLGGNLTWSEPEAGPEVEGPGLEVPNP